MMYAYKYICTIAVIKYERHVARCTIERVFAYYHYSTSWRRRGEEISESTSLGITRGSTENVRVQLSKQKNIKKKSTKSSEARARRAYSSCTYEPLIHGRRKVGAIANNN
uniref:Uncharacterized protein n=1 Tax=Sipha flava TaxID=143950 RepID=A0A2S2Q9A1_9HEMI